MNYFAYGSNCDPERFVSRVGPWKSVRRGRLEGYRLRFADSVRSEGGGGAVIDPVAGAHVYGVLFEINEEQIAAMDREEFDPARDVSQVGRRICVQVQTDDGTVDAQCYTVVDAGGFHPPSERYLGHILRGLEAAGHDEAALSVIRNAARGPTQTGSGLTLPQMWQCET